MRRKIYFIEIAAMIVVTMIVFVNSILSAQGHSSQEQPAHVTILFIDRDGDGINDIVQYYWGLTIKAHYTDHQTLIKRPGIDKKSKGARIPEPGDYGLLHISFTEVTMNTLTKTEFSSIGGEVRNSLNEYLRAHYQSFDRNGDGLPDVTAVEDIQKYMHEMHIWRALIKENIRQGFAPYKDENGDRIPDHIPPHLKGPIKTGLGSGE